MNALKRKLLTKWFVEWLDSEKDTELLDMTKLMIERRTLQVRGPIKVIGFRKNLLTTNEGLRNDFGTTSEWLTPKRNEEYIFKMV